MRDLKVKESANPKSGNGKTETQINKLFGRMTSFLMAVYVLFYLCVFPLSLHNKYFDILTFRFRLFWKPTLAYGIIFLILGLLYLAADALYNKGDIRKSFFAGLKNKGWKNYISSTDVAMTAVIIVFSLSTALAEYPYEAFWGNRGRCHGLLMWLMLYIAYILITRFYKFKKWHIYAFMAFASAVCIWGICNFFLITFGMFDGADEQYKYIFVSSIGNINNYSNFTGIIYGVAAAMFVLSESKLETIYTYLILVIASFAQIMGLSTSVILSTGIVIAATPVLLWKRFTHVVKYFTVVVTYLMSLKITSLVTKSGISTMNDPDPSVQITMAGTKMFMILIAVALLLLVISFVYAFKKKESQDEIKSINKLINAWKILLIAVVAIMVVVLILANIGWHPEIWSPYEHFLIFGDDWGTGRGLIWRLGMDYWINDSTLLAKIIGYGPDTYYIITMDRFMNLMQDAGYGMFDSAHNEYFEYFITTGILGLTAYVSLLVTSIRAMIKSEAAGVKGAMLGVIAYATQAVVNIAIPITTPVFFVLMFAGTKGAKEKSRD